MRREVFQAIADPTRRAILSLIAVQAMTPNAIAERFESSRQAVSKHIKVLTECQLVKQEQSGREIYYYINHNWHSFPVITPKIKYERLAQNIGSRICRMEMGRWLSWFLYRFWHCIFFSWARTLLRSYFAGGIN